MLSHRTSGGFTSACASRVLRRSSSTGDHAAAAACLPVVDHRDDLSRRRLPGPRLRARDEEGGPLVEEMPLDHRHHQRDQNDLALGVVSTSTRTSSTRNRNASCAAASVHASGAGIAADERRIDPQDQLEVAMQPRLDQEPAVGQDERQGLHAPRDRQHGAPCS